MKKELLYPIFVFIFFMTISGIVYLSLQKVGPSLNPPHTAIKLDSLQTSFISINYLDGWKYSEQICTPSMQKNLCDKFKWENLEEYKLPSGKNSLSLFIAFDLSKEKAVALLRKLKEMPIEKLFISSPFDSSLSNTKKVDPSIMFGATVTQIIKWNFFAQLGLGTVYSAKADYIISDQEITQLLAHSLTEEVHRRKIPVLYISSPKRKLLENEYILVK